MAKQRFGINDAYRGAVGTVIGYEWRGRWCLRSRPRHVRNPRTEKQQLNRLLFKQMVQLAGVMKGVLRVGMHRSSLALHMTECNLFVKSNKECFSLDSEGRMAVDWENVVVSDGPLAAPEFTGAQASGDTVEFRFGGEGDGDDEVYVYAYCPEMGEGVLAAAAWRRTGTVRLTLPEEWQDKAVHFYGFAVDYEGVASDTAYIGEMLPEEVLSGWHNICRGHYVINEKQSQSWQIKKNSNRTSSSTSAPRCPKAPIATSSWSATTPPR